MVFVVHSGCSPLTLICEKYHNEEVNIPFQAGKRKDDLTHLRSRYGIYLSKLIDTLCANFQREHNTRPKNLSRRRTQSWNRRAEYIYFAPEWPVQPMYSHTHTYYQKTLRYYIRKKSHQSYSHSTYRFFAWHIHSIINCLQNQAVFYDLS